MSPADEIPGAARFVVSTAASGILVVVLALLSLLIQPIVLQLVPRSRKKPA